MKHPLPKVAFFDFDGVIKDSNQVKKKAFMKLFAGAGSEVQQRILRHHLEHMGVSRYEKLPLYLKWAGMDFDEKSILRYANLFSGLVVEEVVLSEFTPGILGVLKRFQSRVDCYITSATPQKELDSIVSACGILPYFDRCFGYPTSKADAINLILLEKEVPPSRALYFGDAASDEAAASLYAVPFIWFSHSDNQSLTSLSSHNKLSDFHVLEFE